MRLIVTDASEFVCKWVAKELGESGHFPNAYGLGVVFQDKMVAGIVYSNFSSHNCMMNIASVSPHWCSRGVLFNIFWYPFVQCKLDRVTALVGKNNKKSRDLCERLGYVREGSLADWFGPKKPAMIYRMKPSECRWINGEIIEQRAVV